MKSCVSYNSPRCVYSSNFYKLFWFQFELQISSISCLFTDSLNFLQIRVCWGRVYSVEADMAPRRAKTVPYGEVPSSTTNRRPLASTTRPLRTPGRRGSRTPNAARGAPPNTQATAFCGFRRVK